jgi:hypothetical protein
MMRAMNLYDVAIPTFIKQLRHMDRWIDKATTYAQSKKADPEVFTHARLAIDMFDFARQIQSACDTAKFTAAKLSGKEAPKHPDLEKTLPELKARLASVIQYLESFKREDFAGAEDRSFSQSWMQGKGLRGPDYLLAYALPNFYFHVVTGYDVLRHHGVELGKMDFLGELPLK